MNVRGRGRENATADGEDFRGNADGFGEISGDMGERGEKEVAEVVAAKAASGLETILEEAAEQGFVFREGNHAIANVAGRENAILAAKATGAAAVVGNGDDRGEIGDRASEGGLLVATANDMIFQATEKSGEASAAAESDHTEGTRSPLRLARLFHERFEYRSESIIDAERHLGKTTRLGRVASSNKSKTILQGLKPIGFELHNGGALRNSAQAEAPTPQRAPNLCTARKGCATVRERSAGIAFLFRIEELGEARIFLKEVEILVVARVIAVGRSEVDSNLEIGECGIGFAGEAIERGERVMNMVSFGSKLAGLFETLARLIPAAEIHHGHTALVVVFGGLGILIVSWLHALFGDAQVGTRAIGQFPAGASDDLLEFQFGALKFLLVEKGHGLFVDFHLGLDQGIDELDAAVLRGLGRYVVLFL
jgi:hypothetical protein